MDLRKEELDKTSAANFTAFEGRYISTSKIPPQLQPYQENFLTLEGVRTRLKRKDVWKKEWMIPYRFTHICRVFI